VVGGTDDVEELEAELVARSVVAGLRGQDLDGEDGRARDRAVRRSEVRRTVSGAIGEAGGELDHETERVLSSMAGAGSAIAPGIRERLGSALGADLSGVRLHAGARASSLNRTLSSVAFTYGRDIFFRDGLPDTATDRGLHLLAHELTHTVQQGTAPARSSARRAVVPTATPWIQRRKASERTAPNLAGQPTVQKAIMEWVGALEKRVDEAEKFVVSLACLHFGSRPGHMGKFEELLLEKLAGTLEPSKWNTAATKAGYWIEEYSTHFTMTEKPAPGVNELGWNYQVASGKTRPDIELLWNFGGSAGIQRAGWVDITSSSQVGHIDKKASSLWQTGLPYVCEVFYDSIDFTGLEASLAALKGDRNNAPATPGAVLAQVGAYNKNKDTQRALKQEWAGVLSTLGTEILTNGQIVKSKRKAAMRLAMCHVLGVTKEDLKPKDAAAVLLSAGLVPMNYGWPSHTGATAPGGRKWLLQHNIAKPPDAGDIPAAVADAVADLTPTVEMTDVDD
jgi:hypothetical protein